MLFQQAGGLDVDGIVGPNTWSKLCEAVASGTAASSSNTPAVTGEELVNTQPEPVTETNETANETQTQSSLPAGQSGFTPLQQGQPSGGEGSQLSDHGTACDPKERTVNKLKQSTGPVVLRLQNLLLERGFDPGPLDGIFGDKTEASKTEASVKEFQTANALEIDGVVGPQTWLALCESAPLPTQPSIPVPPATPVIEICDDGIDNNLDGNVDENCTPSKVLVGPQQCLPGEEPGSTTTLSLTSSSPSGCFSSPEPPTPCPDVQQTPTFQFFQKDTSPWKFNFGILNGKGLVLQDITAGIKQLQSWSAPQFRIATTDGKNRLVTFCASTDTQRSLSERDEASFHRISWGYDKTLDNGVLSIDYNILVSTKPFFPNSCETFSGNDCFKLLPLVKYTWTSPSSHIAQLEAFVRLDNGDQRGLAVFQDGNSIPGTIFTGSFAHASMLLKEKTFLVVTTLNGQSKGGDADNIHTARIGEEVFVPGLQRQPQTWVSPHALAVGK